MTITAHKEPRTDAHRLRQILRLERHGLGRDEILDTLGISRATYYRRKAEIRDLLARAPGPEREDT